MAGLREKPFGRPIRPGDVRELIDFGLSDGEDGKRYESMAKLQAQGVAALYNFLCRQDFAFLADEVGMGKTYQAIGLAAVLWNLDPKARVVIVSPRANLQRKWIRDYTNFVQNNYRRPSGGSGDDIVKNLIGSKPSIKPYYCDNLYEFIDDLLLPGRGVFFLRHTSFRRPAYFSAQTEAEIRAVWRQQKAKMMAHGLPAPEILEKDINPGNVSLEFNLAFARSLNKLLQELGNGQKAIDLIIVDEAQYLRNPYNQGNRVFQTALENQVGKWLFLSATPVHSDRSNIKNIVEYASIEDSFNGDLKNDELLIKWMQTFLIRRPRRYLVRSGTLEWGKHQYRHHDVKSWGIRASKPLQALAMAVVQKQLVKILKQRNNRFRIGFLSSFESLQQSIINARRQDDHDALIADYQFDENARNYENEEKLPPDAFFISDLSQRFEERFKRPLPHPKVDFTVDRLAERAFLKNEKFLVFCRRINAVYELRDRLDREYHNWIKARVEKVWNTDLDWTKPISEVKDDDDPLVDEDPETSELMQGDENRIGLRNALQRGSWLFNYRQTFRPERRNGTLFQENWLRTICRLKNLDIDRVIEKIPSELIDRAIAAGTREQAHGPRPMMAHRHQYLITHLVSERPDLLNLSNDEASPWKTFLTKLYGELKPNYQGGRSSLTESDVNNWLNFNGFWDEWQSRFEAPSDLYLGIEQQSDLGSLYRREIVKNWIGQSFRLSDTLLDIYFSELKSESKGSSPVEVFFDYLTESDEFSDKGDYAAILRARARAWIRHDKIIRMNCFRHKGDRLDDATFAAEGSYRELDSPTAVVAVVGGGAVNETAIRQFKTPGYPQIIVCTDVLKEGEDLHTFCDQVVHYGVAWTSGDLEQRIGRVDRYFSKIERRLAQSEAPENEKLRILYPHMKDTLEKYQIETVYDRVKEAALILDNFLENEGHVAGEVRADHKCGAAKFLTTASKEPDRSPFVPRPSDYPTQRCPVVAVPISEAERRRNLLSDIATKIKTTLENTDGLSWEGDPAELSAFKLFLDNQRIQKVDVRWEYIDELGVYGLRFLEDWEPEAAWNDDFSYAYERHVVGNRYRYYRSHRLLFSETQTAEQLDFKNVVLKVCDYLRSGGLLSKENIDFDTIGSALQQHMQVLHIEKHDNHKCEISVSFGRRHQNFTIYAYDKQYLIVSTAAALEDIRHHDKFGRKSDWMDRLKAWCLDMNVEHSLGFLQIDHKRQKLSFCERIFRNGRDTELLPAIIQSIAFTADAYESRLTGMDRY